MEQQFIDWLQSQTRSRPDLLIGLGDDAALLRASPDATLVTVDLLTEGVDFILSEVDAGRIGRKALAVNLSDIAAMAGRPTAAVIALALPRAGALELAQQLYRGILPLAEEYGVALAGGDTNTWDGSLVISVTLFGVPTASGPLQRNGAKPGDLIVVTGGLGGSLLGHHFDFQPRIAEAQQLHRDYQLHAGMDISDGLALDCSRLAAASECGVVLDMAAIPISADARTMAAGDGRTALQHALSDGEDFELLLALPPNEARRLIAERPLQIPVTIIGECVAEPGLWQRDMAGEVTSLSPQGYSH